MKRFKKNAIMTMLGFSTILFCGSAVADARMLYNVPHFYEFNTQENPNHYGWCGHAALKITAQYVTGQVKSLQQIHSPLFWNNRADYRNNAQCLPNSSL